MTITPESATRERNGVVIFYVMFVLMLGLEGAIVHGIDAGASHFRTQGAGPYLAWSLFVLGGGFLGLLELHSVNSDRKLKDPILRTCCYLQSRFGPAGYLLNAMFLGGSPGVAIALKKSGSRHQLAATFLAAVLFASVWVPIYVLIWR